MTINNLNGKRANSPTKPSPIAEDTADMKRKIDTTRDRIFLGAFVNAYSRPVIEAKISLKAMRMYLTCSHKNQVDLVVIRNEGNVRSGLNPNVKRRDFRRDTIRCLVAARACLQEVHFKTGRQADRGSTYFVNIVLNDCTISSAESSHSKKIARC